MTSNGLYISYEDVANMLNRDFKWASGYWSDEDVLYSSKEILRLVGARNVFENTHAFINIEDGRGNFPKDVVLVDTVAFTNKLTVEDALCANDDIQFIPMRWMTDKIYRRFHKDLNLQFHTSLQDYFIKSNLTYTLNKNYIFTNIETGVACVFYQKLATDERGYLMIPDNISYMKAICYDVALKVATQLYMTDKLTGDKYKLIERDRDWYVTQAGNSTKIPSEDERIAMKDRNLSWPPDINSNVNFHLNLYKTQRIY